MKRAFLLLFAGLFCTFLIAQDNAIDTYFSGYIVAPDFSKKIITSKTFELITEIETNNEDEQRVIDAIGKIEGVIVLTNEELGKGDAYYGDAMSKLLTDKNYEDLMIVEDKGNNVRFMIREEEKVIKEFVMVVGEKNHFVLASIYGEIDIKSISRLAEVIRQEDKHWFDNFKNVDSEELVFGGSTTKSSDALKNNISKTSLNNLKLSIYPNPATEFINITADEEVQAQLEVGFYSLLGKPIQKIGKVNLPYTVKLANLPAGAYFLRLTDTEGEFRNFRIVKP